MKIQLNALVTIGALDLEKLKTALIDGSILKCRGIGRQHYEKLCRFAGVNPTGRTIKREEAIHSLRMIVTRATKKAARCELLANKLEARTPIGHWDKWLAEQMLKTSNIKP